MQLVNYQNSVGTGQTGGHQTKVFLHVSITLRHNNSQFVKRLLQDYNGFNLAYRILRSSDVHFLLTMLRRQLNRKLVQDFLAVPSQRGKQRPLPVHDDEAVLVIIG